MVSLALLDVEQTGHRVGTRPLLNSGVTKPVLFFKPLKGRVELILVNEHLTLFLGLKQSRIITKVNFQNEAGMPLLFCGRINVSVKNDGTPNQLLSKIEDW